MRLGGYLFMGQIVQEGELDDLPSAGSQFSECLGEQHPRGDHLDVISTGRLDVALVLGCSRQRPTALPPQVIDGLVAGNGHQPATEAAALRIVRTLRTPGGNEHVLSQVDRVVVPHRSSAERVHHRAVPIVGSAQRAVAAIGERKFQFTAFRRRGCAVGHPPTVSTIDLGAHRPRPLRAIPAPSRAGTGGGRESDQLGGSSTLSITWITPLDAAVSAAVTVASLTITVDPLTAIFTVGPAAVATSWPFIVITSAAITLPGTT